MYIRDLEEEDDEPQLTFYHSKLSPFSHTVNLALAEAKADYIAYEFCVDIPDWFLRVNPLGKVPALSYEPEALADEPSSETVHLAGSSVLLEFVAEHYPEANLMPRDVFLRAQVRHFIEVTNLQLATPTYAFFNGTAPEYDDILKGIERIQKLLDHGSGFAVGEHYTIADAFISGLIARLKVITETDIGKFSSGMGKELGHKLKQEKYATFMEYAQKMMQRQSMEITNGEEAVVRGYSRSNIRRAEHPSASSSWPSLSAGIEHVWPRMLSNLRLLIIK